MAEHCRADDVLSADGTYSDSSFHNFLSEFLILEKIVTIIFQVPADLAGKIEGGATGVLAPPPAHPACHAHSCGRRSHATRTGTRARGYQRLEDEMLKAAARTL